MQTEDNSMIVVFTSSGSVTTTGFNATFLAMNRGRMLRGADTLILALICVYLWKIYLSYIEA